MRIIYIALKDLKTVFRDLKALALMILMPLLLIIILGAAMGSMFKSGPAVNKFTIGVTDLDGGDISTLLVEDVLKQQMKDLFSIRVVGMDEGEKLLSKGEISAVVVIPEGFGKDVTGGTETYIEVKGSVDDEFHRGIVESVIGSFAESISINRVVEESIIETVKGFEGKVGLTPEAAGRLMQLFRTGFNRQQVIFDEEDQEKKKTLSALEYYSASMLVMFILFGANQGTKLLVEEREQHTLGRLVGTGTGKFEIVSGKFAGLLIICLLQSAIIILFTRFAYGVHWGSSTAGLILVTFCTVFTGASLGMLIAAVVKTSNVADGLGVALIQVITLLGGGMIPYYFMPDVLKNIAKGTLNWWAVRGYHDLMLGSGLESVTLNCMVLLAMGCIFLAIGIAGFKTGGVSS